MIGVLGLTWQVSTTVKTTPSSSSSHERKQCERSVNNKAESKREKFLSVNKNEIFPFSSSSMELVAASGALKLMEERFFSRSFAHYETKAKR